MYKTATGLRVASCEQNLLQGRSLGRLAAYFSTLQLPLFSATGEFAYFNLPTFRTPTYLGHLFLRDSGKERGKKIPTETMSDLSDR